jgi:hypothetical protein
MSPSRRASTRLPRRRRHRMDDFDNDVRFDVGDDRFAGVRSDAVLPSRTRWHVRQPRGVDWPAGFNSVA